MKTEYAWAALLTALSALIFGFDFGTDPNLAQVLPYINRLADPSLYPGDAFLASFSSFPSLYPAAAALAGRLLPLGPLHLAAYLVSRFLFLVLAFRLAELLTGSRRSAFAAALLAALAAQTTLLTPLGEDPLLKTSFFQSTLAGLAGTWSLLLFLRRRYVPAFLVLGGTLFVNGLLALYLAALYAAALRGAPDGAAMRRGWLALGLAALPWLSWTLTLRNAFGGPGPAYAAMLKAWYPGHYFPSGWDAAKWLRIAAFLPLNLLLVYSRAAGSPEERNVRAFLKAFYVLWAAAFVFGELLPLPRLVNLQFFRSDAFFCLFGVIFAADLLRGLAERPVPGGWALAGLLLLSFMEPGPALYPLGALALLAAWLRGPGWSFRAAAAAGAAVCAWQALALPAVSPGHKKYAVALLFFCLAALAGKTREAEFRPALAACLVLAAALVPYLPAFGYRFAARSLANAGSESGNWIALQKWARDNTPKSAVFLVPPDTYGFRVFSLRSPAAEWLDGGAMHWAPGFETGWAARMADMRAWDRSGPGAGYSSLNERDLARLGLKYGASYAARRSSAPLPLKAVYSNPDFTLYALPAASPSNKSF